MYNNSYGYGVYKRSQVNLGNTYQMKTPSRLRPSEGAYDDALAASDSDRELLIGQDIIHKAREEAALIKREAELEAQRIIDEAREMNEKKASELEQKAKEEGYRYGEALAQQHYNDLLMEAQDFNDKCKTEYEETIASLEQDILNLVLDVAAKVVGDEIRGNSDAILAIVRETILSCTNHEHVVLKVSDEDYEFVLNNEDRLRSMIRDLNDLEIRNDGTLSRGSCVIDTGFGSVDGSCETRLESIKQAFTELLQDSVSE